MGVEVLIVQHGDKVRSAGDPGLTSVGHQQAAKVASWLSENHRGVRSIWASPLRRTRETAAPIAAAFQLGVQTDDRLRERMNWDDDASIDFDEFLAESGAFGLATAMPHGLACLMMATAGSLKSKAARTAASPSTRCAPSLETTKSGERTSTSSRTAFRAAQSPNSGSTIVS